LNWLEELLEPEEEALAPINTQEPTPWEAKDQKQVALKAIEDSVFEEAARVCQLAMRFGEIPYGTTEPPAQWVMDHGQEQAEIMLRYVTAAQMSQKDAPAGIKVATTVLTGLIRSRAEKPQPNKMEIKMVVLTSGEQKVYPSQVVED